MLQCVAIVLFIASVGLTDASTTNKNIYCYYGTWATYRYGDGKFDTNMIDPNLCTHLVYTFVGLSEQGDSVLVLDPYLDLPDNWGRDNFGQFVALKKQNPNVKIILAIGGWNEGSAKYSKMVNSPAIRRAFVDNVTGFLRTWGFDGLDFDWEYPARRDTVYGLDDVAGFTMLLSELRESFDRYDLILSAALLPVQWAALISYDIPSVCRYLDVVNLMTYDMNGAWDPVTGHNSPLYTSGDDENNDIYKDLSINASVEYWLESGCPAEKIMLGVPLYGRTFTLSNPNNNGLRAPVNGEGLAGTYTNTRGMVGYNEFCVMLRTESGWTKAYDDEAKVPYAYRNYDWVTYDDADSITLKVQYALEKKLGGVMVWSVETDDFHGKCGEQFELLKTINRVLDGEVVIATTTVVPTTPSEGSTTPTGTTATEVTKDEASTTTTTTAVPTPSASTPSDNICTKEGFIADPVSCKRFYNCVRDTNGALKPFLFDCPEELLWNQAHLYCDYPENVQCDL